MVKEVYIIGTALNENLSLPPRAVKILQDCDLILGESLKITSSRLKTLALKAETRIFCLDNIRETDKAELKICLKKLSKTSSKVVMFSDMGMPLLFDPGRDWLNLALELGFSLRCEPGPTSWGTACALSLWEPPFWIHGFPSQKADLRIQELNRLKTIPAHIVLMDTPYRFQNLLSVCQEVFGTEHPVFLAWEIGNRDEKYFWGPITTISQRASALGLKKGEFIFILKNPSLKNSSR